MNIFLAVPCLSGTITWNCHDSIVKATHILRDLGHKIIPYHIPMNIYIDRARNTCVKRFKGSDCDVLVFIDSDVGFDPDALGRIVGYGKDVCGGLYPLKQDNLQFPGELYFDPQNNCKEESTGLVTMKMVPTGMLAIRRSVFERMDEHYDFPVDHEGIREYFKTGMVDYPEDNTWFGEDVVFCKRWRAMGGELFVDPNINFTHTGTKSWKGNLHEYLMGLSVNLQESENKA